MRGPNCRKMAAVAAVVQGVVTAIAPRAGAELTRRMLSQNFENTEMLEPDPGYIRQIRALSIGMVAAGIAGVALERVGTADGSHQQTDTAGEER
ncbi:MULTISPECIES: hypothetical protein [Salinibaculum]|uniref:hypothetical protein n=1 Tax=Salinibaculum TaxID=2732368 RepID=UPI0030D08404